MSIIEERPENSAFSDAGIIAKNPLSGTICHITLTQFRNHSSLTLAPEGRSVILTGPNGSGKTNLLEAISLFAPGKGLRNAPLSHLICQKTGSSNLQGWAVSLNLHNGIQLGTGQYPDSKEKRILRCNGTPLTSQASLTHHLCLLWQTPQMDGLFNEGASEQRRFFDRLTAGFDTEHASHIARYEHYMRERNRLLAQRYSDTQWLSSLEQKMAETSVAIAASRLETLRHLNYAMTKLNPAFPGVQLTLQGFAENALHQQQFSALETEEQLAQLLTQSRQQDAANGRSSHGAHKMELHALHIPKQMPAYLCSTGEQKALMLSILLAQTVALHRQRGKLPILLLDEVVAHLDADRRSALFDSLQQLGVQAWLTGTDSILFEGLHPYAAQYSLPMSTLSN